VRHTVAHQHVEFVLVILSDKPSSIKKS
jgi:hypothetical protein